MTTEELKGVLFPNTKTHEKQPDLRGSVKVNGVEYDVAGWKRVAKSGIPYVSLALQKKEDRPKAKAPTHTPKENVEQVTQAVGGRTEFEGTIVDDVPLPF